jgi:hypothetical protein
MDYEIQRCTRRCAVTDKELGPGEEFYSALIQEGAQLLRKDYSLDAWSGPPEGAVGWWKSRMPDPKAKRVGWAPNDVMLDLFEQLEDQPDKSDMRFLLALLLVRRRVMRQEDSEQDERGREMLVLYCPRREATYKVPAVTPNETRLKEIQDELAKLLFAEAVD